MLSKEFLKEAPARYDDMGQPIGAPAGPAQTPDWLKNAGKYISNKIGLKEPVALPDYTASNQQDAAAKSGYTGIDPVQRQRAGMAPATQQEINRYMKDNPAVVGGLTDRNGNPIASGGAQEVERAARAAAPRRGADFDADAEVGEVDPAVIGNRFKTPNELGFQPGGSTAPTPAAAPAPAAAVPAAPAPSVQTSPVPASKIQATPLPAPKAFSEPADDAAAKAYAAADADRQPVKAAGGNDEIEQMKKNAGLPKTEKAINPETGEEYDKLATDAPKTTKAINPETGEEYDKLATDDGPEQLGSSPDELERMQKNAGLATAQSAAVDTAPVPASANASSSYTGAPATAPATAVAAAPEAPAAPAPVKSFSEPAAVAPAPAAPESNPEAELDPAIMKSRFDQEAAARAKPPAATSLPVRPGQQTSGTFGQQFKSARDQGLKTFSYQGKSYSTAMKGAAPATTTAKPAAAPATTAAKPAAAPATTAAKPAAAAAKSAAPVKPTVKESQEINRMRFLAGLSKD